MMKTSSITGFYLILATQFLLIAAKIFMEVKIGLFSLTFTLLFLIVTLVQLNNDEQTEWKRGTNGMFYLCLTWAVYYLFELFNPNAIIEVWNICVTPYALLPLICAFLTPVVIRNTKGIEWLLYIWGAFILIATAKGYWQKNHGFSERDLYFLHVLGGWRTHIIWSGIRYFSCFPDAGNYGVHSAMAMVTFTISTFYIKGKYKRLFCILVALCAAYGLGISGTRSSMAVLVGGGLMMALLSKNIKAFIISSVLFSGFFCFFYFTNIGNSNPFIYKMRSAFHPTEDASYMVRVENRVKMKELMLSRPIGYGIGLSKPSSNIQPREVMPYPPDSWLVSVWVETGIIGLMLYLSIHGILFAWCSWILLFEIKNKSLRGMVAAWLCMDAGFFLATYAADCFQYPNPMPVYIGFALCFTAKHIDQTEHTTSRL